MKEETLSDLAYKQSMGQDIGCVIKSVLIKTYTYKEIEEEVGGKLYFIELCEFIRNKLNISYDDHIINPWQTENMINVYKRIKEEIK